MGISPEKQDKARRYIDSVKEIIIATYLSEFLTKDLSSAEKRLNEIDIMAERICKVFKD